MTYTTFATKVLYGSVIVSLLTPKLSAIMDEGYSTSKSIQNHHKQIGSHE